MLSALAACAALLAPPAVLAPAPSTLISDATNASPENIARRQVSAEGTWWTPSSALDTDCDGKPVKRNQRLSQECVYRKKTAEIRARQAQADAAGRVKLQKIEAYEAAQQAQAAMRAGERADDDQT